MTKHDTHRAGQALILLGLCALLSACSHTYPKPQIVYNPDGSASQYKRHERWPQRDFRHRFTRKAYRRGSESDVELASPQMETIVEEWGPPSYVRKQFKSLEDELVQEWVYLDQRRVFQFVNRELIYEGELTDFEQLLIRRGYPDGVTTTMSDSGITRQAFFYKNVIFPGRLETYNLANGWIVHLAEGN